MRGNDDEKFVEPLFPRVHVRDTEKGWPRAPPRNKMALYEQFTVSSQKSNHGNFCAASGNSNNLRFPIQQIPPATPVRVSRNCSVRQYDAASMISSSSKQVSRNQAGDDGYYAVPVLGNGDADVVHCESTTETDVVYRDGERGDCAEISRVLDNGVMPERRRLEPIALNDNDEDDDDKTIVSDTSVVDSASGQDISEDDVIGAIGQKRFWKAKNVISNQQRLFTKQVFELHRLIKVQRLIAEFPHLLFNDRASLGKFSPEHKHLAPGFLVKPLPRYARFEDDIQKANHNHNMEASAENSPGKSLPHVRDQNVHCPSNSNHQQPNPSATPTTTEPSCFQQPWLIPMMSPSEGFIYKPYLSPPGFASGCRECGHSNNFPSMAYGFPAPPQQQGICSGPIFHPILGYFPPCGLPVLDPATFLGQHIDQRTQPNPPGSLVEPSNVSRSGTTSIFQDQNSCNLPIWANADATHVTAADTNHMDPRPQGDDNSGFAFNRRDLAETREARPGRVIRAVPRNPRLATASAARIFRCIQEERRQF